MSDEYPKYLYKYRAIKNLNDLSKDYAVDALLKNEAIFSNRTNFNDLFDSKIELIKPSPRQFKEMKFLVGKADKKIIDDCISKGEFTSTGIEIIQGVEAEFNKIIDKYAFMCVSKNPNSNLMWSHYSDSHTGFCIEFKSRYMKADKVVYQKCIPRLNTIEMLRLHFKLNDGKVLGEHIWNALRTKLDEWEYESEYRFQANGSMAHIPAGKTFVKVPYDSHFVESIIFGCRIRDDVKKFIMGNMPGHVKFKQALARISTIEIVNV